MPLLVAVNDAWFSIVTETPDSLPATGAHPLCGTGPGSIIHRPCASNRLACPEDEGYRPEIIQKGNAKVYDTIIVGGGSAGSVLAHRLSAKSANKVLLCEAGQDTPPGNEPPEIRDSYSGTAYFDPRFHWTELQGHAPRSSATTTRTQNARRCANTSRRACWAAARRSTARWPIAARRPTTMNGKRAAPRAGAGTTCCRISGRSSAISISTGRITARTAASRCAAFRRSTGPGMRRPSPRPASSPAINFLPDQNGEFVDGYFPVTHSNEDEQRVSAAMGYLDRDTRKRANLTISTDTQVKELLFEGTRCVGVKAMVDGKEQEFRGNEIVLSCGAIHSPAHLLRAGIGPVGHLQEMGIPVLVGLARRRPAADGSSLDLAVVLHPPRRAHERALRGATSRWACAIHRACRACRRATCSSPR